MSILTRITDMLKSDDKEIKELGMALKKEENRKERLNLKLVASIQSHFPEVIISGSTALYLQGIKLERHHHRDADMDLIVPSYINFNKVFPARGQIYKTKEEHKTASGKDFDYALLLNNVPTDVRINPQCRYDYIEFDDFIYKVARVEDILEAKIRYCKMPGGEKHLRDIHQMLGIEKIVEPIKEEYLWGS